MAAQHSPFSMQFLNALPSSTYGAFCLLATILKFCVATTSGLKPRVEAGIHFGTPWLPQLLLH
jgi:hypothetical protein